MLKYFSILLITYAIPTLIYSIASLISGIKYIHLDCDQNSIITLPIWLIVNSIVSFILCTFYLISLIKSDKFHIFLTLFNNTYYLTWSILGTVALFINSTCQRNLKEKSTRSIFINVIMNLSLAWLNIIQLSLILIHKLKFTDEITTI